MKLERHWDCENLLCQAPSKPLPLPPPSSVSFPCPLAVLKDPGHKHGCCCPDRLR